MMTMSWRKEGGKRERSERSPLFRLDSQNGVEEVSVSEFTLGDINLSGLANEWELRH